MDDAGGQLAYGREPFLQNHDRVGFRRVSFI